MINTTLPYSLTAEDAQLDPLTLERLSDLHIGDMIEEVHDLDWETSHRILKSASILYLALSEHATPPFLVAGALYTACLDTAMIWEFG